MQDCCRIHVATTGPGRDTLLLIHGFGENGYSWGEMPQSIAAAYSIVTVDLRGHGDSDWDSHGKYQIDQFVADVTTVMDRLEIRNISLAGHSMGADIALRIAAQRKTQVAKLVLVEFSLSGPTDEVLDFTLAQFNSQFRAYDSLAQYHELLREQRPLADAGALSRYSTNSVRLAPGGGYTVKCDPRVQAVYGKIRPDYLLRYRAAVARLACPLLLVRGSGSAIVSAAAAQEVVALTPRAQLRTVSGAGHAVMMDRPNEFNDVLSRFLLSTNTIGHAAQ
jgi:pimeloyl-ACP methyl ester carboxylesterase